MPVRTSIVICILIVTPRRVIVEGVFVGPVEGGTAKDGVEAIVGSGNLLVSPAASCSRGLPGSAGIFVTDHIAGGRTKGEGRGGHVVAAHEVHELTHLPGLAVIVTEDAVVTELVCGGAVDGLHTAAPVIVPGDGPGGCRTSYQEGSVVALRRRKEDALAPEPPAVQSRDPFVAREAIRNYN